MLRQTHLGASAGTENYKRIAHVEFNEEEPEQFRFSTNAIASSNFSDTTTTKNWTSTNDYIDGRDFYFDYPDGVENTAGVFFEFGEPGGEIGVTNYMIELAGASGYGPSECNDINNLVWDDLDKVDRTNELFGWDTADETGTALEFECWPAKSNEWVDESDPENFVATAAADQTNCKGRKADLEKYIVVTLGRDHDAQCDWVAACNETGTAYGKHCTDPLNKANYPNNQCNTCAECENPCNLGNGTAEGPQTEYFLTENAICGSGRKNKDTTLNKQNEHSSALCKAITTKDGDITKYIKKEATPTSDNVFETCPEGKKCDGSTDLDTPCPADNDSNFFNDGTGNGCIPSGIGFETNSTKNGVTECAEGKFAGANENCRSSGINKQPKFSSGARTGEVEACAAGEVALADAKCSKCDAGKYAGSDGSGTDNYNAGKCDDCPTNTYSAAGATECSSCPARHISVPNGPVPCERCETGEVVKDNVCTVVAEGKYQKPANDTEFECGDDSMTTKNFIFNSGTGSDGCEKCAEYDPDEDDTQYWQEATGAGASATKCALIPAGKKRFNDGNNSLVLCPAGEYSAEGEADCQSCSAGTYSDAGAGECTACGDGYYSGNGASHCKSPDDGYKSTDKISQVYCGDGFYSHATNFTQCIARTTSLNSKDKGTSETRIRISFNLNKEHMEVDRVRCGTEEERDGERPVQGTGTLASLVGDLGGATGRCRCKRPFGASAASVTGDHFETDETTGCANNKGQCVGRLSCQGSCNRQDRSNPNNLNCEVIYAKNGAICVGYHGNIPTKWSQTWAANAADVTCNEAVVSTLDPELE